MNRCILSSIILWAAAAGAHSAENQAFELRNGAVVMGPVLKETPSVFFVDLGYDVLTLPRDDVASHSVLLGAPALERLQGPTRRTAQEDFPTATTDSVTLPSESLPKTYKSTNEMIESTARSVCVVSTPHGLGAGFIISPDGRVLTNFHVVRDERFCEVTLFLRSSGRTSRVKIDNVEVLASSALLDVALLKIPAEKLEGRQLPSLALRDTGNIVVGSPVYAIGNPGMGAEILEHSVSEGIVSSRQRNINDIIYIQTTAAVNPGNSGGPLLDAGGRVAGLVTYKAAAQENIAFALPAYYIRHFLANEEAYAVSQLYPNSGFRYLSPE